MRQSGFTYVMVLAAVVIAGIAAEVAHIATWRVVRAEREAELLFRGEAYVRAIQSYYQAGVVKTYPRSLEDLLHDPRYPDRRHIRALYADPMGADGRGEWVLLRAPGGGIAGVASASREEPLKRANFPPAFERFNDAKSYAEWIFEFRPIQSAATPAPKPSIPH